MKNGVPVEFLAILIVIGGIVAWDEKDAEAIKEKFIENARYELPAEDEYIDEIVHGHRRRDGEKHERQKDCMCVAHFIDPHCGSDEKDYDNGCFFMCAQQRTPGLRLKRWGKCPGNYEEVEIPVKP